MANEPPAEGGNSAVATLTRFFIFEASEDLLTWTYQGAQVARDRQQALNRFYPKDEREALEQRKRVAVSENAWRPEEFGGPRPSMPPMPRDALTVTEAADHADEA